MEPIYKNIRKLRVERGLSQDQLAQLTGYTDRSSIAKIENGKVDLTLEKSSLFAKALGVDLPDLVGWQDVVNDAELLADLAVDPEMLSYIRKLRSMTDSQRGRVFGYIDSLLSDN